MEARLATEPFYQTLFTAAFGDTAVTSDRISRALAQFVRSIVSAESKFDLGRASNFANFSAQENQGRQIFIDPGLGNCAACHGTDNFVPGPTSLTTVSKTPMSIPASEPSPDRPPTSANSRFPPSATSN